MFFSYISSDQLTTPLYDATTDIATGKVRLHLRSHNNDKATLKF